jgi:hypothetical protein
LQPKGSAITSILNLLDINSRASRYWGSNLVRDDYADREVMLRQLGPEPMQRVRQGASMRLRRHLTNWMDRSPRPVAERLKGLIKEVDKADWMVRLNSRQVCDTHAL